MVVFSGTLFSGDFNVIQRTLLVAIAAAGLFSGAVQANTITLDPAFTGFADTVECDPSCEGLVGDAPNGDWDFENAEVYSLDTNASPAEELAQLNNILGLTGTGDAIVGAFKPPEFDEEASSFTGMPYLYFAIKKGGEIAYFQNTSGVPVDFTLSGGNDPAEDDLWSHVTGFGPVVPIPAAVWLFGSALVGLVGIGYRGRAAQH
jgi:hypothetical protein